MASRHISAILWTLVSVNVLTLVLGGLITWLGYAIPARLKQFGLLPELVIIAGFASLVVACMGLCALNYSSHLALNAYGASCAIFMLLLLLGIPESWYKSDRFMHGSTSRDIIYFSLLALLVILLVFAFTFAHYLRRQESSEQQQEQFISQNCNSSECICVLNQGDLPNEQCDHGGKEIYSLQRAPTTTATTIAELLRNNHHDPQWTQNQIHRNSYFAHNQQQPPSNENTYPTDSLHQSTRNNHPKINTTLNNDRGRHNLAPRSIESVGIAPLVHKSFYQTLPDETMIRAKSFNGLPEDSELQTEDHWNRSTTTANGNLDETTSTIRDDTLIQYGRKQRLLNNNPTCSVLIDDLAYNSKTIAHCRCNQYGRNLTSGGPNYGLLGADLSKRYSTYAVRQPARRRVKGSSSIVAVTASAAAALFGGVADMSSMTAESKIDDSALYDGIGDPDVDETVLANQDRCDFEVDHQELDAAMLDQVSGYCGGSYEKQAYNTDA